jgi:hypothetical protein
VIDVGDDGDVAQCALSSGHELAASLTAIGNPEILARWLISNEKTP